MLVDTIDASSPELFGNSTSWEHSFDSYNYDVDECMLVRTTPFFPFNGVIQSPENASCFLC